MIQLLKSASKRLNPCNDPYTKISSVRHAGPNGTPRANIAPSSFVLMGSPGISSPIHGGESLWRGDRGLFKQPFDLWVVIHSPKTWPSSTRADREPHTHGLCFLLVMKCRKKSQILIIFPFQKHGYLSF